MEALFTLPLFVVFCLQAVLAVLLLLPSSVSLPVALSLKPLKNHAGAPRVQYVAGVLGTLLMFSLAQLLWGDKYKHGDSRLDMLGAIDTLRGQVLALLCASNALLMLLLNAAIDSKCALDSSAKNLDAFKRQVKGLTDHYQQQEKASKGGDMSGEGAVVSEAAALRKQVDRLIADKAAMQVEVDASAAAAKAAETRLAAMVQQVKGLDKEYDRVLDENKVLQRQAALYGGGQGGGGTRKND